VGRFSGVLLASDYDDTLYNRSGLISPRNRAALQHFVEEGGLFTISTGRSYINFAIQMERERLPVNVPVVLSNGAAIYDFQRGRLLWQSPLPKEAAGHLQLLCAAYPQLGFEAYYENEVYTFRANGVTRHHLKRCCLEGLPREIQEMPGPWVKVILQHEDPAYLNQVQEELCLVWGDFYEVTFSNPYLLEVTAKGANKGSAVEWVAQELGIRGKDVYCVGNGLNDISMLAVSAVPYAPSDCYQELKDWGAVLLPPCDEDCIAHLIGVLEERYQDRKEP